MSPEAAAKVRREQAAPLAKQIALLWSRVRCLEEQVDFLMEPAASVDTHPQGGDAQQAPSPMGSAVAVAPSDGQTP